MNGMRSVAGVGSICVLVSMPVQGQEVAFEPCREQACNLVVDWTQPATNDRRYGNPADLEALVLQHLLDAGYAFARGDKVDEGAVTFTLRPRMERAMCDQMAGLDPSMNCQTIGEVRIAVHNVGPGLDMRSSLTVRGKCGADQMMTVPRMSEYVAAMIVREFLAAEKGPKPSSRC